jgi:hypothetical protein
MHTSCITHTSPSWCRCYIYNMHGLWLVAWLIQTVVHCLSISPITHLFVTFSSCYLSMLTKAARAHCHVSAYRGCFHTNTFLSPLVLMNGRACVSRGVFHVSCVCLYNNRQRMPGIHRRGVHVSVIVWGCPLSQMCIGTIITGSTNYLSLSPSLSPSLSICHGLVTCPLSLYLSLYWGNMPV